MAVQQTKGNQLTDRLNALAGRSERPSEFEIHALKREIDQVRQSDIAGYYMLLGMLFSIAGDYEKSSANHRRSIAQVGDDVTYANYGLSLRRLGRSLESIDPLYKSFEMNLGLESFLDLLRSMVFAGDFSKFEPAVGLVSKAHPESDFYNHDAVRTIVDIRGILKMSEVPESEFSSAMVLVERILTEADYTAHSVQVQAGSFDGVSHAYIELYVEYLDAKTLTRLNDQIADALIGSNFTAWDRMIFNVIDSQSIKDGESFIQVA